MYYWELIVQILISLFVVTVKGSSVLKHSLKHFVIFIGHVFLLPIILRTHSLIPLIWYIAVGLVFLLGSIIHVLQSRHSMHAIHKHETFLNIAQLIMSISIEAMFIQHVHDAVLFRFVTFCTIFPNAVHKSYISQEYDSDVDYVSLLNSPFSLASGVIYTTLILFVASLFPSMITLSLAGLSGLGFFVHVLVYKLGSHQGAHTMIKNKLDTKGWDSMEPIKELPDGKYRMYVYTKSSEFGFIKSNLNQFYNFIQDWYFTKNQDVMFVTGKFPFIKSFEHSAKNITASSDTDYTVLFQQDDEIKFFRKVKDGLYIAKTCDLTSGHVKLYHMFYDVNTIDTIFNDV